MMDDSRRKAWETRRAKYGPRGHSGSYSTSRLAQSEARLKIELALVNIGQARRQFQMLLPDRAAHRAIDRIDNAERLLTEAFMPTFSATSRKDTP